MLIIDCINQLKDNVKLYESIYNGSERIADILMRMDRENIQFTDLEAIFDSIVRMHKSMPPSNITDIDANSYFKGIDYSFIDNIKNGYEMTLDVLKDVPGIESSIYTVKDFIRLIDKFQEILKYSSDFWKIEALFKLYNAIGLHTKGNHNGIYNIIFKACLEYRNDMIKYVNSIELPTKGDWE